MRPAIGCCASAIMTHPASRARNVRPMSWDNRNPIGRWKSDVSGALLRHNTIRHPRHKKKQCHNNAFAIVDRNVFEQGAVENVLGRDTGSIRSAELAMRGYPPEAKQAHPGRRGGVAPQATHAPNPTRRP